MLFLQHSYDVTHLGHILTPYLDDKNYIIRAVKDLNRKANSLFLYFSCWDLFVNGFVFKSYCLSLYGCSLWSLSSSSIKLCEVALKKLLRKLWRLPRNSWHILQWSSRTRDTLGTTCLSLVERSSLSRGSVYF